MYDNKPLLDFAASAEVKIDFQSQKDTHHLQRQWLEIFAAEARAAAHRWPDFYDAETMLDVLDRHDFRVSGRRARAVEQYEGLPRQGYLVLFTVRSLPAMKCEGTLFPVATCLSLTSYTYDPLTPYVGELMIIADGEFKWTALMTPELSGPYFKIRD